MVIGTVLSLLALLVCLASLHLSLFTAWYSGFRRAFTRVENVHLKDIKLAIQIAEAGLELSKHGKQKTQLQERRLALLFMLRTHLVEIDAWRRWLQPEGFGLDGQPSVSLFFHLADGLEAAGPEAIADLQALPGARVIPTVATGWCELMAAEVALFQAALQHEPSAEMLVLLPHDAVPLQSLSRVLKALLDGNAGVSRICPAGVRDIEVPHDCAHGIEPHWARSLMLKHHQWIALSRRHAAHLVHPQALAAANGIFESEYLGEPLCSDEVFPLLTLALKEQVLQDKVPAEQALSQLMLYVAAARGNFEQGLREMDARAECILYAPWPGCGSSDIPSLKRAKSPILGGGMSPTDRDGLLRSLASRGVLFARKLGLYQGNVSGHMAMLDSGDSHPRTAAPVRFLPLPAEECCGPIVMARWGLATIKACLPVPILVAASGGLAWVSGKLALAGGHTSSGLPETSFQRLITVYVTGHLAVFLFSVLAFPEYSLLEPFRKAGLLQRPEL